MKPVYYFQLFVGTRRSEMQFHIPVFVICPDEK